MARPSRERAKKQAVARIRKASTSTIKPQNQESDADPRSSHGKAESALPKRIAGKAASARRSVEGKARDAGSEPVTIDRRREDRRGQEPSDGRRPGSQGSQGGETVVKERRKLERRAKVNRRRQIDPTTCERDYSQDEIEFMAALDAYKRTSGRMFPTCSEVLEVLRGLGYEKRPPAPPTPDAILGTTELSPPGELNGAVPPFPFAADAACETLIPVPAGA